MKTLKEHNDERLRQHDLISSKSCANGIACPKCGSELHDSNPMVVLTSYPAKKNIHCPSCGYSGYRLA